MFEVKEDAKQLSENKGEILKLVVAKLLLIMKRYRTNLDTAVSFLMTRVSKSDVDNSEKNEKDTKVCSL